MIGILLGGAAAAIFAVGSIFFKIGQRTRPDDDGLFLSVLVNVVVLGAIASFLTWPEWDTAGFVGLLAGGLIGTVGGRWSSLKAIRIIGPSRANAFLTANPLVAAAVGWVVLGEGLGLQELIGGILVTVGLLWLIRSRSAPAGLPSGPAPLTGYLWAIAAPTFFGFAFVVRKWGLTRFPGPVIGTFVGACAALTAISIIHAYSGRLGATVRGNLLRISWWYVGAGLCTTVALLFQFTAFSYLPAWVVGVLQGTQGLWTLLLGWLFLRQEERIDARLVTVVLLVVAGVTLIGLEV